MVILKILVIFQFAITTTSVLGLVYYYY